MIKICFGVLVLFAILSLVEASVRISFDWFSFYIFVKDELVVPDGGERGWTLNSIGYNRGFADVLKRLMDYKVSFYNQGNETQSPVRNPDFKISNPEPGPKKFLDPEPSLDLDFRVR